MPTYPDVGLRKVSPGIKAEAHFSGRGIVTRRLHQIELNGSSGPAKNNKPERAERKDIMKTRNIAANLRRLVTVDDMEMLAIATQSMQLQRKICSLGKRIKDLKKKEREIQQTMDRYLEQQDLFSRTLQDYQALKERHLAEAAALR